MKPWDFARLCESPTEIFEGMPFRNGADMYGSQAEERMAQWIKETFGDAPLVLEKKYPVQSFGQAPMNHRYYYRRVVNGVVIAFYQGK